MLAAVLSQGDEVVTGQIADTNAAFLATRLTELGFQVERHLTVGDDRDAIRAAFVELAARVDVVVCTGGLGPTDDDLTAQAAADALGTNLGFDAEAMRQIEEMYARYSRTMPEVNRKQAWLPAGSARIDNRWGTAPGFAFSLDRAWVACMPGVPREMERMFEVGVVPTLIERFSLRPGRLVTLRTTGVGESVLQERIGSFSHPQAVLGYRTILPENHVKIRFSADVGEDELRQVVAGVRARLGDVVFGVEGLSGEAGGPLAEVVGRRLAARDERVAVAESCTGGVVASMITAIPGSSAWFTGGVVAYANEVKSAMLGVSPALLAEHGAVSEPVARAMAEGVRARLGATWGLSTTGVAGPGGGTDHKPVGLVHIAVAGPEGTIHREIRLGGQRTRIQQLAAAAVIDALRRRISA